MLADLAVELWVVAHGRVRRTHHCANCAPRNDVTSIDCVHCGDGPLVIIDAPVEPATHILLRTALTAFGWNTTAAGAWVCGDCRDGQTAGVGG